ncbi:MAG: hypothetical protein RIS76_4637, partial [Verrucomicrobiota bacterium]
MAQAAWMGDVIGAPAEAASVPGVMEVKGEGGMDPDRGLQGVGRLPGPVADSGHRHAIDARRMQRDSASVDGDGEAFADESRRLNLKSLQRAVHVADRSATSGFIAQDVPGFQRGAELDPDI